MKFSVVVAHGKQRPAAAWLVAEEQRPAAAWLVAEEQPQCGDRCLSVVPRLLPPQRHVLASRAPAAADSSPDGSSRSGLPEVVYPF